VLQLVAAGLTNGEIADRLYLSESTIKSHLSSSFRRLGVSSRAEAAAAVLDPDNGIATGARLATSLRWLEHQLLTGRD
jgi:orotate phosphoribosyltransferase-like protein